MFGIAKRLRRANVTLVLMNNYGIDPETAAVFVRAMAPTIEAQRRMGISVEQTIANIIDTYEMMERNDPLLKELGDRMSA